MKVIVNSKDLEQSLNKVQKFSQLFINEYDKAMIQTLDVSLIHNNLILQNHYIKIIIDCEVIEKDDKHRIYDIENFFNLITKNKDCKIELSTDSKVLTIKEVGKDRQKQISYILEDNNALHTMPDVDIDTLGYFNLKYNDLKEFTQKNKYTFDCTKQLLYNANISINDDNTLNLAITNPMILSYLTINDKNNKQYNYIQKLGYGEKQEEVKEVIIYKKNIDIILDVMEDFEKIYFNYKYLFIKEKNIELIIPIQDDVNYPRYRKIIIEHNNKERSIVKFNAKELYKNIEDVKFNKYISNIKLHIIDNTCTISATNDSLENKNKISCQSNCDITIIFKDENLKFLSLFKEDTNIEMSIVDNNSPVSIILDTSAIKYMVMPVVA